MLVDSHIKAVEEGREQRIQAIDMGRRGLHNEGAELMTQRLAEKIDIDFDTARRLFTLVCVLHQRVSVTMKIDGIAYRSVWLDAEDGWSVHILDQTKLPWSLDVLRLTTRDEAAHAINSMQTRGAPLIGAVAAYGLCLALRADASTEAMERDADTAERDPADGGQPALGAGPDADAAAQHARPRNASPSPTPKPALIADEDVAQNEAIGRHGLPLIEAAVRPGQAGERADPLQRRLAGHGRLGHRAGADLHRVQRRHRSARLGGRDAPAQPGRRADRVGARQARRAAHRRGGQRRRAFHAARHGRSGDRRRRPGLPHRRRRQQDRHLPEGPGGARQRRAVLGGDAVHHHRLDAVRRRRATSRSRNAPRPRSPT